MQKNNEGYKNKNTNHVCRLIGYMNSNTAKNTINEINDIELYKAIDICKNNNKCKSFEFKVKKLGDKKGIATFFSNLEPVFIEHGEWNKKKYVSLYYKKNTNCTIINDIGLDTLNMKYINNSTSGDNYDSLSEILIKTETNDHIINDEMKQKAQKHIKDTSFGSISNNDGALAKINPSSDVLDIKNNGVIKANTENINSSNVSSTVNDVINNSNDILSNNNISNIRNVYTTSVIRKIRKPKAKFRRMF